MKTLFHSCFAEDIEQFVQKKHDAGFQYYSSEHTLHQFDRFCTDCCISTPEVTKTLVNAWLGSFDVNDLLI